MLLIVIIFEKKYIFGGKFTKIIPNKTNKTDKNYISIHESKQNADFN